MGAGMGAGPCRAQGTPTRGVRKGAVTGCRPATPEVSGSACGGGGGVGQDRITTARSFIVCRFWPGPAALSAAGDTPLPAPAAWLPAQPPFAPAPLSAGPVLSLPSLPSWVSAPL